MSQVNERLDAHHLLALRAFPPLARLATHDLVMLARVFVEERIPPRTVLFRPDEPVSAVFFILSGQIETSRPGHRELVEQGSVGFAELFVGAAHGRRAVTATRVTALVADASAVFDLLEDDFPVLRGVLANMATEVGRRAAAGHRRWCPPARDGGGVVAPVLPRQLQMSDKMRQLARHGWVARQRLEAVAELARDATVVDAADGDLLWRSGDAAESVWLVLEGSVSFGGDEGGTVAQAGGEIGALNVLAGTPRSSDARAVGAVRALVVSAEVIFDVIEDQPGVGIDLVADLAAELLRTDDEVTA